MTQLLDLPSLLSAHLCELFPVRVPAEVAAPDAVGIPDKNALPAGFVLQCVCDQFILTVPVEHWYAVALRLRDAADLAFELLIDVAGVDYSTYKNEKREGHRFEVVYQLLSVKHNARLRVRVALQNNDWPSVASVVDIWSAANWYEREAYDLFGILFENHPDLRRILTDYGFVGHPFRKDFPLSGHVEMRYDAELKRVVYQPVTIEPREITPRIVREEQYARSV